MSPKCSAASKAFDSEHKHQRKMLTIVEKNTIKEMKNETLNASWKKLWREAVHNYKRVSPDKIHHVVVAKLLGDGFTYMTTEGVNNMIEAHQDPFMDEDLTKMTKSASEKDEEQKDPGEEEVGLSLECFSTLAKNGKRTSKNGTLR
ncbi:Hypothetical predicted protein [Octopus vulgaris]|uniref:Uncharacterized protein n=1 Tax=Octopus vulgaris TaxID=6645 RepID=A0AA36AYP8_OCTVU|nr:Hypothetical predicted protein [Octopus vulgaris]